jgi:hypothetical protein
VGRRPSGRRRASAPGSGRGHGNSGSAIGMEGVTAILTQHVRWTVYWSSLGPAPRPPASAASGTIQFTRRGDKMVGHLS